MTGAQETVAQSGPFWQASPEYHGVLRDWQAARLAVSPNGKRYLIQKPQGAAYRVARWRKSLRLLLPDLPQDVAEWANRSLPDDPQSVPRLWADSMLAASERVKKTLASRDEYAGVIRDFGDGLRLILTGAQRYAVQQRGQDGAWYGVASASSSFRLIGLAFSRLPDDDRRAVMCGHKALQSALVRLPEMAAQYAAPRAETPQEALQAIRAGVGPARDKMGVGGPLRGSDA